MSCVKQDVGADDANFLGAFNGKLPGPISLGGLLAATVLEFSKSWHTRDCNEEE